MGSPVRKSNIVQDERQPVSYRGPGTVSRGTTDQQGNHFSGCGPPFTMSLGAGQDRDHLSEGGGEGGGHYR